MRRGEHSTPAIISIVRAFGAPVIDAAGNRARMRPASAASVSAATVEVSCRTVGCRSMSNRLVTRTLPGRATRPRSFAHHVDDHHVLGSLLVRLDEAPDVLDVLLEPQPARGSPPSWDAIRRDRRRDGRARATRCRLPTLRYQVNYTYRVRTDLQSDAFALFLALAGVAAANQLLELVEHPGVVEPEPEKREIACGLRLQRGVEGRRRLIGQEPCGVPLMAGAFVLDLLERRENGADVSRHDDFERPLEETPLPRCRIANDGRQSSDSIFHL
jgi:hypothetical protein